MIFQDRSQAGRLLAERLIPLGGSIERHGKGGVVLGLPRGGLAVARPVAEALGLPLDIVVARKIGAPGNPEFAIGAVTARGTRVLNERALRAFLIPPGYLEEQTEKERRQAERREALLRGDRSAIPLEGKVLILVDDGIATGMTVRAALADLRAQKPASLIVAVPVIAPDTLREFEEQGLADAIVYLDSPADFFAIGQFYREFPQLTDQEARSLLGVPR